jgi:hypothetical protein
LWFDIQNTASSQLYGILNNDYFNGCKNNFVGYLLIAYWIDYPSLFHKKYHQLWYSQWGILPMWKKC